MPHVVHPRRRRSPDAHPCARRRGGGIGARLKRHPPWPARHRANEFSSLFSRPVEEAFLFMRMCQTTALRHRHRRHDGGTAPASATPSPTPISSSCGSTRSAIRTSAGALAGRRLPVIVTCRPTWEGGGFTGSEEERRRMLAEALDAWRRVRRHRMARAVRRPDRAVRRPPHRAVDSRFPRRAGRPDRARSRDALDRRRDRQGRRHLEQPERLRCRCSTLAPRAARPSGLMLIGMGDLWPRDPRARRPLRIGLDVRRQRRWRSDS